MKNIFTNLTNNIYRLAIIAILVLISFYSDATNHLVTAQNYVFTPSNFTAVVGDSVTWEFLSGSTLEHQPASTTIPTGAATWDQTIDPANPDFTYVITVAGVYHYQCNFHVTEGMIGQFTVGAATGITNIADERSLKVYPIPFQQNLTIDLNNNSLFKNGATIEITNMIGQRKFYLNSGEVLSAPLTVNLSDLEPGIYFLTVSEGVAKKTIRLIKSE